MLSGSSSSHTVRVNDDTKDHTEDLSIKDPQRMTSPLRRFFVYSISASLLMIAGLCTSFFTEQEGPGASMGYVGLLIIYILCGLPLSLLVAASAELTSGNTRFRAVVLTVVVLTATLLFLQTDKIFEGPGHYFMSNPNRPPIVVGRSFEFMNPSPKTIQSNVNTYFPLLAITTFLLPIAVSAWIYRPNSKF